jgi:hypothetical protein
MRIFVVRGKQEREVTEPANTSRAQDKWWADLYCALEDKIFEALTDE